MCGTDEMDAVRLATHYIDMHTTDILPHYNVTYPCTEANEAHPEPLQSTASLPASTPAYTECSVGEFQYVCGEEGCNVGYCSIVDLRLHQEQTHSTVTLDRLLFRCHRCSEVLTYDDFMQHVDEGHCQTCDICHKVYKSTNSEIARHRRCREQDVKRHRTKFVLNQSGMMVPELRFDRQYGICDICGQILTESENTHRKKFHPHMHISISSQPHKSDYECQLCGARFQFYSTFKSHGELHKSGRVFKISGQKYSCPVCRFVSFDFERLGRHIREHYMGYVSKCSSFLCTLCDYGCMNELDLHQHLKKKHYSRLHQRLTCKLCNTKRGNVDEMSKHSINSHQTRFDSPLTLPPAAKPFTCMECSAELRDLKDILEHAEKHKDITPLEKSAGDVSASEEAYPCPLCNFAHIYLYKVEKHIKRHFRHRISEAEWKPFECCFCHTRFITGDQFRTHLTRYHFKLGENSVNCKICGQSFTDLENSLLHVKSHQSVVVVSLKLPESQTPFKCLHCAAEVRSDRELAEHSVKHRGSKPIGLNIGRWSEKLLSNPHRDRITAGSKITYSCPVCGTSLTGTDSTKLHIKKHFKIWMSEKSYNNLTCCLCTATFSCYMGLYNHLTKTHFKTSKEPQCCVLNGDVLKDTKTAVAHSKTHQRLDGTPDAQLMLPSHAPSFVCIFCEKEERVLGDLVDHAKIHIGEELTAHAQDIARTQSSKMSASREVRRVSREKANQAYPCVLCDYSSADLAKVKMHSKSHFRGIIADDDLKHWACTFCETSHVYASRGPLENHVNEIHFLTKDSCEVCLVCKSKCVSKKDGWRHLNKHRIDADKSAKLTLPQNMEPFKCLFCCDKVRGYTELIEHSRKHRGLTVGAHKLSEVQDSAENKPGRPQRKCQLKNKDAESVSSNKECQKEKNGHRIEGCHVCEICGTGAKSRSDVNRHILECHLGEGPYTCEHCNEIYQSKEDLLNHLYSLNTHGDDAVQSEDGASFSLTPSGSEPDTDDHSEEEDSDEDPEWNVGFKHNANGYGIEIEDTDHE